MIVSERLYERIPHIWLIMGILFMLFGLAAGTDYRYFYLYPLLSAFCVIRSYRIYRYRRKFHRRQLVTTLTETQKIERNAP